MGHGPIRMIRSVAVVAATLFLSTMAVLRTTANIDSRSSSDGPELRVETLAWGLSGPTSFALGPGDRIYVAEKAGQVKVVTNGVVEPTPFIDLSDEVSSAWDRGLLSIALDPAFPNPAYVYLLYTYDPPGTAKDTNASRVSRLLRVEADADNLSIAASSLASRTVILGSRSTADNIPALFGLDPMLATTCTISTTGEKVQDCVPSDAPTHSIGGLAFAHDGSLYVSIGDASDPTEFDPRRFRAQDLDTLAGKVVRINPHTGEGYADNPFYDGNPNSNRSKVVAYGLRNPFRISLHPSSGELLIGDVGMGSWEELDIGSSRNFGWPCYEGGPASSLAFSFSIPTAACNALYALGPSAVQTPALAYDHSYGKAIIAGPVMSGTLFPGVAPEEIAIADFDMGWIRLVSVGPSGQATIREWLTTAESVGGITQLLIGPDGSLYYSFYDGSSYGEIRRVYYGTPRYHAPIVYAQVSSGWSGIPRSAWLTSSGTFDPDGDPLTYTWSLGNGLFADGPSAFTTYPLDGLYTATLMVTDTLGLSSIRNVQVSIASVPILSILTPTLPATFTANVPVAYGGIAWDPIVGYRSEDIHWRADLHHETHVHSGIYAAIGVSGVFSAPSHGGNAWIMLCAAAPDANGILGNENCVAIFDTIAFAYYFPVARR